MATVADFVGFHLPDDAGEDSFDLLPILHGSKLPVRKDVVHHSYEGMFGLRSGDWKIEFGLGSGGFSDPVEVKPAPDGPPGQLYNLRDDPDEKNNLWLQRPDIVTRLTATMESYKRAGHTRPFL